MAVNAHLKIDGLDGESATQGFEKQIDVLSWSFGATQTGSMAFGGGGGSGKVSIGDLNVVKRFDKASPKLFEALGTGKHIKEAILTLKKAGGDKSVEYLNYKMTDIMISSVNWGGASDGEYPTETLSINFAKIEVVYTEQDNKGVAGAKTRAGFDVKLNQKF
jgi:type VI secretion system secreted protein Hcp